MAIDNCDLQSACNENAIDMSDLVDVLLEVADMLAKGETVRPNTGGL